MWVKNIHKLQTNKKMINMHNLFNIFIMQAFRIYEPLLFNAFYLNIVFLNSNCSIYIL